MRELRVLDATRGTTDRARLALAGEGGLPATLFAKLAPRHPATRICVGRSGSARATQQGDAVRDVAYFATLSLHGESRRACECALLAAWREALAEAGAEPPAPDEVWRRHRLGTLDALAAALVTVGADRLQPGPVARAGPARAAAAVSDLDALALVA